MSSLDIKSLALGAAAASAIFMLLKHKRSQTEEKENKNRVDLEAIIQPTEEDVLKSHQHEEKMKRRTRQRSESLQHIRTEVLQEMGQERDKVTVRVPATSANLGPGFDTLGVALDMWAELTVERADKFEMICEGDGADKVPLDETNLLYVGVEQAFKAAGKPVPPLRFHCTSSIPFARGMGSSSAAIVGGLVAGLSALLGARGGAEHGLGDRGAPGQRGARALRGHPAGHPRRRPVAVGARALPARAAVVIFIPEEIGITKEVRAVLKPEIPRADAIYNIGRVAWLVNALATANVDNLRWGCEDALHQPQRGAKCFPHMQPLIDAALAAGADGAYLSGAGPTILAVTSGASGDIFTQRELERVDKAVGEAMARAAADVGVRGQVYVSRFVEQGATVVAAEPSFSGA
eukprot:CAMPEP_0206416400 /NCGR_PEP_ID=MMETSP0294-20121207/36692_1 /ASSEMBLY_ACC=CAM_ASM_000327 /TAXON_ID=39354 /ORGANISM="Heterosigma akashiwo, Strain CCMP2393" /LENGTH=405 /DNA_ID=CAMNT_0053878983 /DNA_START=16 /DNA_END=1231 /DNA_ORIENTATION=-